MLELDAGLAGAYCGHLLSLLGADVVKVESGAQPPVVRTTGPFVDDRPNLESGGTHVHLDACEAFNGAQRNHAVRSRPV